MPGQLRNPSTSPPLILAARRPDLVDRLVLVSSVAFEERYTRDLLAARLARLSESERAEAQTLLALPGGPKASDSDRFGALMGKADAYDSLPQEPNDLPAHPAAYAGVRPVAAALRRSGELLRLAGALDCSVTAIHGADDPSPAVGVREPFAAVVRDLRFVLLARCGHEPWAERWARDAFFAALRAALSKLLMPPASAGTRNARWAVLPITPREVLREGVARPDALAPSAGCS
jgi:pimeloyl-ACP methyl ester carboxylesterase